MFEKLKVLKNKAKLNEFIGELSWITRYSYKYRFYILLYIVMGLISIVMTFASTIASKYLIDAVQYQQRERIVPAVGMFVGMGLASMLFSSVNSRVSAVTGVKVTNDLRGEVFSHILGSEWQDMMRYHTGDILNRLSGDIPTIVKSILSLIPGLITKIVQFIGAFFIIFYYDRIMACIALMGAPLVVFSSRVLLKKMRYYNVEGKKLSSDMMSFAEEMTQNISFIKSFDLVDFINGKFDKLQQKQKKLTLEFNKFSIITSSVITVIGLLVSYSSYGWGVYRLWNGAISYGTMILFIQLASNLTSSFSSLVGIVPEAISATTCAGRIKELMDIPPENIGSVPLIPSFAIPDIVFDNVSFGYKGGHKVFDSSSFRIKAGEITAFIGKSGSGKTTILRMLLGLIHPETGKLYFDYGKEKVDICAKTRYLFSYVSQENMLFSGTVADNMRMVRPEATDEEIETALKIACADFVFDLPQGINSFVMPNGKSFSQGQIQRLSIARALVADSCVLLLDEATSSLDKETEKRIITNLFGSDLKKTCILTTHRDSMLDICDSVYRVHDLTVDNNFS